MNIRFRFIGWFPRWSWPYLALDRDLRILDGRDGTPLSNMVACLAGWWSQTTAFGSSDTPGGQRLTLLGANGTQTPMAVPPAIAVGAKADAGHWASCVGGAIRIDGHIVDSSPWYLDSSLQLAGDWLSVLWHESADPAGPTPKPPTDPEWQQWTTRVYHQGVYQRTVVHQVAAHRQFLGRDGTFGYSDNARVFLNGPDDITVEVTATVPAAEFGPLLVDGPDGRWLWTPAGEMSDALIVRRVGALTGWRRALPFGCSDFDVVWAENAWQLAWHNSVGSGGVAAITLDEADAVPLPLVDPAYRDCVGDLLLLKQAGQAADVEYRLRPESGALSAIRYLDNGVISQPADNALTHTYDLAVGHHTLSVRGVGKNGKGIPTNLIAVVVDAPVVVPPPIVVPPPAVESVFYRGLNAGNGTDLLGDVWMQEMADRGVTLDRRDCANKPTTVQTLAEVEAECRRVGIRPFYLGGLDHMRQVPEGSWFELGNGAGSKQVLSGTAYGKQALDAMQIASDRGLRLWLGCLDNISDEWLAPGNFLDQMVRSMGTRWADARDLTAHWYSHGPGQPWNSGHNGRASKQADVNVWLALIRGRNFIISETGYDNATHIDKGGIFKKWEVNYTLSEADVLQRLSMDDPFWERQPGCRGWCAYQLVDAAKSDPKYDTTINRYGWRAAMQDGGRWKKQSEVWVKAA